MKLGRARIVIGVVAALSALAAIGATFRSSRTSAIGPTPEPAGLRTASSGPGVQTATTTTSTRPVSLDSLRAQWLDAEAKIRSAGVTTAQELQTATPAKNTVSISAALNQEVAAVSTQDKVIAGLPWPSSIRPDVDAFLSSSASALDELRTAAADPLGYDAAKVNAAITQFNAAADVVRRDLGLPPDQPAG